jgi:leucyl/phenylalanyl-tRNA---protein transferase
MSVFALTDDLVFPDPSLANSDGLLAVGGDLSIDRLLLAYKNGIFPWFNDNSQILWWALDPRMVLFPHKFKISKSLQKTLSKNKFEIRFDNNFREVVKQCSKIIRKDQDSTWITDTMVEAYHSLFKNGYAHSVEAYINNELVGGLYGVSIGKVFFGESMFHKVTDASKVAFAHLVSKLEVLNYELIDAQMETPIIKSLGGELIPLSEYRKILSSSIDELNLEIKW